MDSSFGTFYGIIKHNAQESGAQPAFISANRTITHQQFLDLVDRLSSGLSREGISPGDRICILAQNSIEFFVLYGACARSGAIAVPINWRSSTEEIRQVLALAQPAALFLDDDSLGQIDELDLDQVPIRGLMGDLSMDGFQSLPDFYHPTSGEPTLALTSEDPFVILTTAAVEGVPRGALLSHANLLTAGDQLISALSLTSQDRHLAALPLFHVTSLGLSLATLQAGGTNVLLGRFDPGLAVQLMDAHQVTLLAAFPPVLTMLLDARQEAGASWGSLKYVLGLDSPEVIQRLHEETGAVFWTGFGQSETSGVVTLGAVMEKPGSAGRPLPVVDVRCFDENGEEVAVGSPGEIVVQGPLVFQGYWRDHDATEYASRRGWHHTGDLGQFDEQGYLYYLGRKPEKDLIKSGGENVYPAEVEHAISTLPQVRAVCVFGVHDETWGEAVKAVVEVEPGATLTAKEVEQAVVSRIASYKKPRSVEFVDALPRTPEGHIDRQAVKETCG